MYKIFFFITFVISSNLLAQNTKCIFDGRYVKIDSLKLKKEIKFIAEDKIKEKYILVYKNKDTISLDNYSCDSYGVEINFKTNFINKDTSALNVFNHITKISSMFIRKSDNKYFNKYFTIQKIIKVMKNKKKTEVIYFGEEHIYDSFEMSIKKAKNNYIVNILITKS